MATRRPLKPQKITSRSKLGWTDDVGNIYDNDTGQLIYQAGDASIGGGDYEDYGRTAAQIGEQNLQTLAQNSSPGYISQIIDKLPQIAAFLNAQQIAQINVDRARRGLNPVNAAAYGPQVGVAVNPQTQQFFMNLAIVGGIGFIAYSALSGGKSKRR